MLTAQGAEKYLSEIRVGGVGCMQPNTETNRTSAGAGDFTTLSI